MPVDGVELLRIPHLGAQGLRTLLLQPHHVCLPAFVESCWQCRELELTLYQAGLEAAEVREVDGTCLRPWFRRRTVSYLGPLRPCPEELAGCAVPWG